MHLRFRARCDASVAFNGISKVLLTVDSDPHSQDEHLLLNLLRSRGEIEQGKNYIITITEESSQALQ